MHIISLNLLNLLDLAPFKILKTVGYEKDKFNLLLEFSILKERPKLRETVLTVRALTS